MEKKIWTKPEMKEIVFSANEYVAACGDENKKYLFTCDAGGGKSGYVWIEDNKQDGLQSDSLWSLFDGTVPGGGGSSTDTYDDYLSGYHACGLTHEASTTDDFYNGYYLEKDKWNNGRFNPLDVLEVIIWRGPKNNDTHCTTNLNMDSWVTAKS